MRALLFLFALVPLACSSSDPAPGTSSQGGAGGASALADFLDRTADAICDNVGACCQDHGYAYDAKGCHAWFAGQINPAYAMETLGATIDAAAIDECVARATEYASACVPSEAVRRAYEDACARVVTGPKAIGEVCSHDHECAQPAGGQGAAKCYQPSAAGGDTVCMIRLPPEQGLPCRATVPSFSECSRDDALFCSFSTGKCETKQPLGSPCLDTGGCLAGSSCRSGTCLAQGAPGEDCGGYADGCADGDACDPVTKLCVARLPDGADCTQNLDCRSVSCQDTCQPRGLVATTALCDG